MAGIRLTNQITVVSRHMTAARKSQTTLEAILRYLKVKQQTGKKQRRRGCPNKQVWIWRWCQASLEPFVLLLGLLTAPWPAVVVGRQQHTWGFQGGSSLKSLLLKISSTSFVHSFSPNQMKTYCDISNHRKPWNNLIVGTHKPHYYKSYPC